MRDDHDGELERRAWRVCERAIDAASAEAEHGLDPLVVACPARGGAGGWSTVQTDIYDAEIVSATDASDPLDWNW